MFIKRLHHPSSGGRGVVAGTGAEEERPALSPSPPPAKRGTPRPTPQQWRLLGRGGRASTEREGGGAEEARGRRSDWHESHFAISATGEPHVPHTYRICERNGLRHGPKAYISTYRRGRWSSERMRMLLIRSLTCASYLSLSAASEADLHVWHTARRRAHPFARSDATAARTARPKITSPISPGSASRSIRHLLRKTVVTFRPLPNLMPPPPRRRCPPPSLCLRT
jgi:hypothetical protein